MSLIDNILSRRSIRKYEKKEIQEEILKNVALAERLGFLAIAGSDSHDPETIGDAYTVIEARDHSPSSVLEAVKSGKTEVFCRPSKAKFKVKMFGHAVVSIFQERTLLK